MTHEVLVWLQSIRVVCYPRGWLFIKRLMSFTHRLTSDFLRIYWAISDQLHHRTLKQAMMTWLLSEYNHHTTFSTLRNFCVSCRDDKILRINQIS
jgi:hypothetical protein